MDSESHSVSSSERDDDDIVSSSVTRYRDGALYFLPERWQVSARTLSLPVGDSYDHWGSKLEDLSDGQWNGADMEYLPQETVDALLHDEWSSTMEPAKEICRLAQEEGGLMGLAARKDPRVSVVVRYEETDYADHKHRHHDGILLGVPRETRALAGIMAIQGSEPTLCMFWYGYLLVDPDGTCRPHHRFVGDGYWRGDDRRFCKSAFAINGPNQLEITFECGPQDQLPKVLRSKGMRDSFAKDRAKVLQEAYQEAAAHVWKAWQDPQMFALLGDGLTLPEDVHERRDEIHKRTRLEARTLNNRRREAGAKLVEGVDEEW